MATSKKTANKTKKPADAPKPAKRKRSAEEVVGLLTGIGAVAVLFAAAASIGYGVYDAATNRNER